MKIKEGINSHWIIVSVIIIITCFTRLIPHVFGVTEMFNFSPIGGIALFGAAYFVNKSSSFLLPLIALWLTNLVLDNIFYSQYYDGFVWFSNWEIYFAFALIVSVGILLLKKISAWRVLTASLSASIIFFVVSNFFVWLNGTMYPKTADGLIMCYVAAIPFFWNTLSSDLFFSALLFGGFEWAKRSVPLLIKMG